MLRSKQILSIKNKLCICIAGKCPPQLCDFSGSTSALASVGASVIVGKKPTNGFFYLTRFGWVAAVMADFRTRAVKGKGFSPRGVPVREFPSLLVAFFAIWLLACVAGVSNRVIARKLEREQKKKGGRGRGRGEEEIIHSFPPPPPSFLFFFCSRPCNFLDELARKRLLRRLFGYRIFDLFYKFARLA